MAHLRYLLQLTVDTQLAIRPPPPAHTGQVPDDSAKGKDIVTQTENVLAQIDALLARAGSDKTKILSAQVTVQLVF